jgi:hypothetical protein
MGAEAAVNQFLNQHPAALTPRANDPKSTLTEIEKAVDRDVGMKKWGERFTGANADDEDFFEGFSWPGLIETALAEIGQCFAVAPPISHPLPALFHALQPAG